jgi:hypothetical protein
MFQADGKPRRPPPEIFDAGDSRAFDERGVIRDNCGIRINVALMDAEKRAAAAAPMHIWTNREAAQELHRHFYPDGTPKLKSRRVRARDPDWDEPDDDDDDDDNERLEEEANDAAVRTALADQRTFAGHRPGFVLDADRSASERAYAEMCRDLSLQYMSDEQRAQYLADERLVADARRDGRDQRLEAYDDYCRWLGDAWKPKDSAVDVTKAGTAAAKILPPGAVQKFIGINPGDSCTIDGRAGSYVDGGDGLLYCRPHPMGAPTRVPASNPSTARADAVPRTMSAADAQVVRDAAWREYCQYLEGAWRS